MAHSHWEKLLCMLVPQANGKAGAKHSFGCLYEVGWPSGPSQGREEFPEFSEAQPQRASGADPNWCFFVSLIVIFLTNMSLNITLLLPRMEDANAMKNDANDASAFFVLFGALWNNYIFQNLVSFKPPTVIFLSDSWAPFFLLVVQHSRHRNPCREVNRDCNPWQAPNHTLLGEPEAYYVLFEIQLKKENKNKIKLPYTASWRVICWWKTGCENDTRKNNRTQIIVKVF